MRLLAVFLCLVLGAAEEGASSQSTMKRCFSNVLASGNSDVYNACDVSGRFDDMQMQIDDIKLEMNVEKDPSVAAVDMGTHGIYFSTTSPEAAFDDLVARIDPDGKYDHEKTFWTMHESLNIMVKNDADLSAAFDATRVKDNGVLQLRFETLSPTVSPSPSPTDNPTPSPTESPTPLPTSSLPDVPCVTWDDQESNTSNQLPRYVFGSTCNSDVVSLEVTFADGLHSYAEYHGMASKWNSSTFSVTASNANGFQVGCNLHYLYRDTNIRSLPMAWNGCSNKWSNNFDLDTSVQNGSNFRASTTGWNYVRMTACCGAGGDGRN